jgi:hypothetical protein
MPRLFYTDHYTLTLPPGHKFPGEKYRMLRETLTRDNIFTFEPAPLASRESVELVHDPNYVTAFFNGTLDPAAIRRIGFPWSEGLVRRTLASVGSTLAATREAFAQGWGGTLAGGTHHAFVAEGSGFCVSTTLPSRFEPCSASADSSALPSSTSMSIKAMAPPRSSPPIPKSLRSLSTAKTISPYASNKAALTSN